MVLQISPKYVFLFKFEEKKFSSIVTQKHLRRTPSFPRTLFREGQFASSSDQQLFNSSQELQEREQRYFIFWSTPGAQFCLVRFPIHCGSQRVGRGTWLSFLILHGFKLLYLLPQSMRYKESKIMMVVVMMMLTVVMMTMGLCIIYRRGKSPNWGICLLGTGRHGITESGEFDYSPRCIRLKSVDQDCHSS